MIAPSDNADRCTDVYLTSGAWLCRCHPDEESLRTLVTRRCVLYARHKDPCVIELLDGKQLVTSGRRVAVGGQQ